MPNLSLAAAHAPRNACVGTGVVTVRCYARYDAGISSSPVGFGPEQFHSAYNVPSSGSSTRVGIVSAYNDAQIKADLDRYDATYGLSVFPVCSSNAQASCFERVDQRGGQNYGASDAGWATETALDVETVHEICPSCRIELVQADSATLSNLFAAVDRAVALGSRVVSMSWGGAESPFETNYDGHLSASGVTFVASSGDSGYGVSYPAASKNVVAVGGTTLSFASGAASETAWGGSGSGCSRYESKPAWQSDSGCFRRTVADVSADANPASGAAIYTSTSPSGGGWLEVGGTSLAAPLVAGMAGLNGGARASKVYGSVGSSSLYDVTRGTNGRCLVRYLCTAGVGFDGPTGVGTPRGLGAL